MNRPVCFCVGAGEDITFDVSLSEYIDARVFIFDPTPRAIAHVEEVLRGRDQIVFRPWAIWTHDGEVELFSPADPHHVSHSIVNLQQTEETIFAKARTLPSVMREFEIDRIDMLKLDIEGAEYAVLDSLLASCIDVGIINVEFDELSVPSHGSWARIRRQVAKLTDAGYDLIAVDMGSNYTFVKRTYAHNLG